ncbi:hypothetical protein J6I39_08970 [bacterium]|nr:hypothetical protein [bacterium]
MVAIRRLNCFDYPKLKKLISYLCNDDSDRLAKNLMQEPLGIINAMLPLSMKFRSESFILIDNKEILGLITCVCTPGNPYKINITRLIFKENRYEIGKQLVEFLIQKMGGKGATTFKVVIDECHNELFDLFVNGCGFRQCSSETLWKNEHPVPQKSDIKWRYAQNSDSEKIAELYNSEVVNIFKPSLLRYSKEFQSPFFQGFTKFYKTRYIYEETNKILGYFSVTTEDNLNYILDITTNSGYDIDYAQIINVMLNDISRKKHEFYPVIKQKKYTNNSQKLEDYLNANGYYPIQTRHILVKDFYKTVKEESKNWNVFILGESQILG